VLRRWIAQRDGRRAGSAPSPRQAAEFRLERAAAIALARAAESQARLPIFVEKVERGPMTLAELPEYLPERALLAVIEGRREALGVVAICPGLLASLIEMQAIGRVATRLPPPRRPTRTDAAISADFVNALLAELGRECPVHGGCPDFAAFRYATYMDDPRPLALLLEDVAMTRLELRFRIGAGGQRDGSLMIALPDGSAPVGASSALPQAAARPSLPGTETGPPAAAAAGPSPAGATLARTVQQAPIRLVGILGRRRLALQQLRGLTPGTLLPLPQNVLDEARVETAQGQFLARGRLGEKDGFHAIRLRAAGEAATAAGDGPAEGPAKGFGPALAGNVPAAEKSGPPADIQPPTDTPDAEGNPEPASTPG